MNFQFKLKLENEGHVAYLDCVIPVEVISQFIKKKVTVTGNLVVVHESNGRTFISVHDKLENWAAVGKLSLNGKRVSVKDGEVIEKITSVLQYTHSHLGLTQYSK